MASVEKISDIEDEPDFAFSSSSATQAQDHGHSDTEVMGKFLKLIVHNLTPENIVVVLAVLLLLRFVRSLRRQ